MPYDQGQTIKLNATVTDPDTGNLFDPGMIAIKSIAPSGAVTVLTAIHDATGKYHALVVVNEGGEWAWRVDTTVPTGGAERIFTVNPSRFP